MSEYYEYVELSFKNKITDLFRKEASTPDIIETLTASINIMQDRITRINLAVTPVDVFMQPHRGELKMLDFDQVEQTIEEGISGQKRKLRI